MSTPVRDHRHSIGQATAAAQSRGRSLRHPSGPGRQLAGLVAAATVLTASLLGAGVAPATAQVQAAPTLASLAALPAIVGEDQTAGWFYDGTHVVVNVTSQAAADKVEAAGGTARVVGRSTRELNATIAKLNTGVVGTAWWADPVTNQVVVDTDESVTGAKMNAAKEAVSKGKGPFAPRQSRAGSAR